MNEVKRLSFASHEDFKAITEDISKMNDQELDQWEKNQDFVSFRTVLNTAYKESETIQTEKDLSQFLDKYNDILTLEDSILTPSIKIYTHQAITNRDGIYQTGEYLNKIIGDYVVTADKSRLKILKTLNSTDQLQGKIDGVQIFRYVGPIDQNSIGRTNASCGTNMFASYFKNESGCRNDREVNLFVTSYRNISTNTSSTYYYPKVEIIVQPRKRLGTVCSWTGYDNPTELRNTSFSIYGWQRLSYTSSGTTSQLALYSFTLPYVYNPYGNGYKWTQAIGDWTFNEPVGAFPFTTLHAEGKSQGVGVDGWAVIDCR